MTTTTITTPLERKGATPVQGLTHLGTGPWEGRGWLNADGNSDTLGSQRPLLL